MRIITCARPFIDIDAYGCIVAYAELLQKQDITSRGVSTSILNGSITPTVLSWQAPLAREHTLRRGDTFTLVDISDYRSADRIVDAELVDEIIDHHPGFEEFWRGKIGAKAQIEPVGAACTLVYERWQTAGLLTNMSQTSARVLVCGILDNTLNFGAKLTTARDRRAYKALLGIADLPPDWPTRYFGECQENLLRDVPKAIDDDFKQLPLAGWEQPVAAGQLAIWDASTLLGKHLPEIKRLMAKKGEGWFMNIIDIGKRRSYFACQNPALKSYLTKLLDIHFKDDVATASRMWLRKEISARALERVSK